MFPEIESGVSAAENTYYAGLFGGLALVALVPATLLFIWGLRTLRQESEAE